MSGVQTPSIITQTAGAGAGAAPTVLGQVTVTQLPDKLTGLARALAISGMVTEQQGDQATLRTAAGDVQVRTETSLPTDRPVTLQIPAQTTGAALTATVVAQAATQAAAQAGGGGQAASATQTPPALLPQVLNPAASLPALQVGTTLAAVLLNPAPAANTGTPGPDTPAPVSDINQGQGLGLIVGARGDTGDQPDLTDDSPQQPPSQPALTPSSSTSATAPASGGTAPPQAPPSDTGAGDATTTGTGQPSSAPPPWTRPPPATAKPPRCPRARPLPRRPPARWRNRRSRRHRSARRAPAPIRPRWPTCCPTSHHRLPRHPRHRHSPAPAPAPAHQPRHLMPGRHQAHPQPSPP
ncbi:hypothetical protein [Nitrospirillum sp. BR 11163]|uniref:hypothetical protein n=1 Tax=Nitrospirillum sp. BR 11163 TaxID=3104323 RepID=UPI002AFDF708|nr:hypothetical protein [Nitrospirillum sp. BR 11163]MEA1676679.1 hypothetical protein [Nitrospirillum sp. BR 11163]